MIQPQDDRRSAMTPQLAMRVAIVGSVALAMFAIVFFRLWFLQVLSTNHYANAAVSNQTRKIDIPAPRGEITDRYGNVLVRSTQGFDVELQAPHLPVPLTAANFFHPPAKDMTMFRTLDRVLNLSPKPGKCPVDNPLHPTKLMNVRLAFIPCSVVQQLQQTPYKNVTIALNVDADVQEYLGERDSQFRGVTVQEVSQRSYPYGNLAAQVLGTVGPITTEVLGVPGSNGVVTNKEIAHSRFKGLPASAQIGQGGLEYEYDHELRGTDGTQRVAVNADGQFEGDLPTTEPVPGDTLRTTLDAKVQAVGQAALQESINENAGDGGAFVAMDPQNGQIYAMGSNPTYDPSVFTKPISQAKYESLFGPGTNDPQLNRATQSAGATGSTFKLITATAALESGTWTPNESFDDTGRFCEGAGLCLHNSGGAAYGVVDMVKAIQVSDDVFFYNLGRLLNANPLTHPNGGPLQEWAHKFGIGRKTGIDLPGEVPGTLPSPKVNKQLYAEELQCENATGPYKNHPKHPASSGGCGIASNPYWTSGDNVNTAVGQGDDQVTPLQLATAYATMANGGTVVTPHIGMDILNAENEIVQRIAPAPKRHLKINPLYRETIMAGLRAAVQSGTSADVMGTFPEQVYGKTGTAQYITAGVETDYAWYACFVPASATTRPIVVVVTVEKGGFGDVAAAPVARQILSQWFLGKPGPFKDGSSNDT
jgi:penicillin-binding protein 2